MLEGNSCLSDLIGQSESKLSKESYSWSMVWSTCLCLVEGTTSGADDLRGEEEEE